MLSTHTWTVGQLNSRDGSRSLSLLPIDQKSKHTGGVVMLPGLEARAREIRVVDGIGKVLWLKAQRRKLVVGPAAAAKAAIELVARVELKPRLIGEHLQGAAGGWLMHRAARRMGSVAPAGSGTYV